MEHDYVYEIGFECDGYWNPLGSALKLKTAREMAKEIGQEYEARPEIRKVKIEEKVYEYIYGYAVF